MSCPNSWIRHTIYFLFEIGPASAFTLIIMLYMQFLIHSSHLIFYTQGKVTFQGIATYVHLFYVNVLVHLHLLQLSHKQEVRTT